MAKKNSDFVDFHALFSQYRRRWYMFAISLAACLLLAFIYIKRTPEEYSVKANVLISQQKDAITEAMGAMSDLFGSDGYVEDEIFIISSHSVYRDVAKALRLNISHYVRKDFMKYEFAYPDYPVDIIPAPGIADTLSSTINFKIAVDKSGMARIKAYITGDKVLDVDNVSLPHTVDTPLGLFTVAATDNFIAGEPVRTNISVRGYDAAAEMARHRRAQRNRLQAEQCHQHEHRDTRSGIRHGRAQPDNRKIQS